MFNLQNSLCLVVLAFLAWRETVSGSYVDEQSIGLTASEDLVMMQRKVVADVNEMMGLIKDLNQRLEEKQNTDDIKTKELPLFDIRYDPVPVKCHNINNTPTNCDEATSCIRRNGVYAMQMDQFDTNPFHVECDTKTLDGGWIVIQRRQDGSEDFYRDWSEYKRGFGNIGGEFFIGLDKLYALTNLHGQQELFVELEDKGESRYARYSSFVVGNETEFYALKSIGKYSGTAGDSLQHHVRMKFTTKDRDNDFYETNCAQDFMGAWWYNKCHVSNLNGHYGDDTFGKGINWFAFKSHNRSIEYIKMMIRRRRE